MTTVHADHNYPLVFFILDMQRALWVCSCQSKIIYDKFVVGYGFVKQVVILFRKVRLNHTFLISTNFCRYFKLNKMFISIL